MSTKSISKLLLTGLIALSATAAIASPAFAKNGADDPAGHNAGDVSGGHGADDPINHG